MTTTTKTTDYKAIRDKLIAKNKLTLKAEFVPFSQSRNNGKTEGRDKWESLNWNVTLLKDSRPVLTTEYSAGSGHCPASKNPPKFKPSGQVDSYLLKQAIALEIETGKIARFGFEQALASIKPIPPPDLVDVLYSLIMDSDVLESSGFEEWAKNYGYDTDSRSAEKTYRQCLEIALKLRAGLGNDLLSELREAFTDY